MEAFTTVTKEVNRAIDSKDSSDLMCIAMLMLPLMSTIDEFMKALREDVDKAKKEESSSKDPLDDILHQIKPNESIS